MLALPRQSSNNQLIEGLSQRFMQTTHTDTNSGIRNAEPGGSLDVGMPHSVSPGHERSPDYFVLYDMLICPFNRSLWQDLGKRTRQVTMMATTWSLNKSM